MKKFFLTMALMMSLLAVNAQETTGDLYEGLTKKLTFDRMIPPHGLEVTYDKTVHLIFPAQIRYVDLGSSNIIAGKADDAENVLRVKAAIRDFETETNLSVICNDGSFFAFNVKYAEEPEKLNIEMQDFLAPQSPKRGLTGDIHFKDCL